MLFDQLCDYFRSVAVACYSISCLTFFDQLWLHVIRSVTLSSAEAPRGWGRWIGEKKKVRLGRPNKSQTPFK